MWILTILQFIDLFLFKMKQQQNIIKWHLSLMWILTILQFIDLFLFQMKQHKNIFKWHLSYTVYTCADGSVKFQTPTTVLVSGSPMKVPSQATWTWAGLNPVFMHSTYSIPIYWYQSTFIFSFMVLFVKCDEKTALSSKPLEI